ncbi:MAG: oligosaccharide flippase family protein [Anaerolineales bacterium]|nr:oligosaccharide flippase family protein [Anaerolineales bacterium]
MPTLPIPGAQKLLERLRSNPLTVRVLRNTSYVFSASTLSAVLSMLQSIMAGRLLGVEAFGLLGVITQFSSVINKITSFRMSELVVSYIGEYTSKGDKRHAAAVFKIAGLGEITSSFLAFLILLALAPLGARYLAKDPQTVELFMIYGLSVVMNLISESATGLLQIFDRFRTIAMITVAQSIVTLLLIGIAYIYKGDLFQVVLAYLVGKGLWAGSISIAALWTARAEWGPGWWKSPLSLVLNRKRDLFRFAISTNLSGTINLVTRDSDILWLTALSSPLQAGYYKVAKAFMNVLLIPVTPLISTTYREVAREVAAKSWKNVRYLLRSGSLISAIWTVPASLGLILFGPWLVQIYGSEFLPAYPILLILLVGVIAANIIYWSRSVLLPLGMPDFPVKVGFIAAAIQIVGMLVLVPRWGAPMMALMMSVFFVINSTTLLWKTILELRRAEDDYPVNEIEE